MLKDLMNSFDQNFLPSINISIKVGVIVGLVVLIVFFICWAIASASKISKYRKTLINDIKGLNDLGMIDKNNVSDVNEMLKKHPEEVQNGWSDFLDQGSGYPSNYMQPHKVLTKREFSGKSTLGKVLFGIIGIILVCASGVVGFLSQFTAEAVTATEVLALLQFLLIPVAVYVICALFLGVIYSKQIVRLEKTYASFIEVLDNNFILDTREVKEFESTNLDDVSQKVQELIDTRKNNDEVIEVISVPSSIQDEELPEEFVDEPIEEVNEEEVVEEQVEEEKTEEPVEEVVEEAEEVVEEETEESTEPEEVVEETTEEEVAEEETVEAEEVVEEENAEEPVEETTEEEQVEEIEEEPASEIETVSYEAEEMKQVDDMDSEEKEQFINDIIDITAEACFDSSLSENDFFELAEYLDYLAQKTGAYDDPDVKEGIDYCFDKLAKMVNFED